MYKHKLTRSERPEITSSGSAVVYLLDGYDLETIGLQEQFVVLYLNRANAILGVYRCSAGGITGTVADVRLILSVALKIAATSMIISHNHPSGNMKPSKADEDLTAKIKQAAAIMDIRLLDHLILSPDRKNYFSFADEGMM